MTTVQEAREALGARLRGLRRSANLTGRALAQRAGWDNSKVSRYEHGKQMPTVEDIRVWCTLTDSVVQIPDLIAEVRNIDASYLEWRRVSARRLQQSAGRMEAAADLIRGFDTQLIPGLLQTGAYATTVLRLSFEAVGGADDLADAVAERGNRQRAVRDGNHRCHFVIPESALYITVGGHEIMAEQIEHLLDCLEEPWLTVGLLPNNTPIPAVTGTNFLIYDGEGGAIVRIETESAGTSVTDPVKVAIFEKNFRLLADSSVVDAPAKALLEQALEHRKGLLGKAS